MLNSCISVRLNKKRVYSAWGGVALMALLSSSSLGHAVRSEEQVDVGHVACLWHLGEKTHRLAALEILKKNALTGKWQAHLRYLKRTAEYLKEDSSYNPLSRGSSSGPSQSEETPFSFFDNLHAAALGDLSSSDLSGPEKDFETIRLNFFHERVKKRLSGQPEEPLREPILSSLRILESTPDVSKALLFKVRFFQNYYLSDALDADKLEDVADKIMEEVSRSSHQEERDSLGRFAARIHFKLAESVPFEMGSQKRQSHREYRFRKSANLGNALAKFYLAEISNDESSDFYNAEGAFHLYVGSANQGCSLAAHKLATLSETGNEKLHIPQDPVKALEWHRKASQDHPSSQYILGKHLLDQDQEETSEEGLSLVRQSAEHGYSSAQFLLGQYYRDGKFVDQNPELGFYWLNQAAEHGEPQAYYPTAYALENGIGVDVDYGKAIKLYSLAAKYDDSNALIRLGKFFLKGLGSERPSEDTALFYFQQAQRLGSREGKYYVGRMTLLGQGLPKPDPTQAFTYLKEASEEGHIKASEKVGIMSQFGLGTTQSFEEAKKAYEASHTANSFYHLGGLYKRGLSVHQDPLQALSFWEQAADLGHTLAAYRAGKAHFKIWRIDNNVENGQKAYLYLSQASESLPDAMVLLAYLQKKGIGCDQDSNFAMSSYRHAAERGHAHTQYKMGQFIEEVAQPGWEDESFSWYEKAALQNHENAQLAIARFYSEGIGRQSDFDLSFNSFGSDESKISPSKFRVLKQLARERRHEQSLKLIEQLADKDNASALLFMAKATEEGVLVPQDTTKAVSLYERAWRKGDRSAYLRLKDLERAHVLKTLGIEISL